MALSILHTADLAIRSRNRLSALVDDFDVLGNEGADPNDGGVFKLEHPGPDQKGGKKNASREMRKCNCGWPRLQKEDTNSVIFRSKVHLSLKQSKFQSGWLSSNQGAEQPSKQHNNQSISTDALDELWIGLHEAAHFLQRFLEDLFEEWVHDKTSFFLKYGKYNQYGIISLMLIHNNEAFRVLAHYLLVCLAARPELRSREALLARLETPQATQTLLTEAGLEELCMVELGFS